jgi:hypothetical protein
MLDNLARDRICINICIVAYTYVRRPYLTAPERSPSHICARHASFPLSFFFLWSIDLHSIYIYIRFAFCTTHEYMMILEEMAQIKVVRTVAPCPWGIWERMNENDDVCVSTILQPAPLHRRVHVAAPHHHASR